MALNIDTNKVKIPEGWLKDNTTIPLNNSSDELLFNSLNNQNINSDTYTNSNSNTTDGCDDGKISFGEGAKSFFKGLISPITSMFSSPKNFLIGAAMIVGGAALIAATGGAAAPVLVAAGAAMGGVQVAKGAIGAATAKTDEEAKQAFENIGSGTGIVAMSVAGAKSSLNSAGINTEGLNPITATAKCFTTAPKNISNSIGAFTQGKALTNIKSALNIKETTSKPKQEATPKQEPEIIKETAKPTLENEVQAQPKTEIEQPKVEPKVEVKQEPGIEAKPEVKAEQPKVETKLENPSPKKSVEAPDIEIQAKNKTAEPIEAKSTVVKYAQEKEASNGMVENRVQNDLTNEAQSKPLIQEIVKKDGTKVTVSRNESGQIIESKMVKPDNSIITKNYENGRCVNSSVMKRNGYAYDINETSFKYQNDGKIASIQNGDFKKTFNYNQQGDFAGYVESDYANNINKVFDAKGKLIDTKTEFSSDIQNAIKELNERYPLDKSIINTEDGPLSPSRKTTVFDKQTGKNVDAYVTDNAIYVEQNGQYQKIGSVTVKSDETAYIQNAEKTGYDIRNLYGSKSQAVNRYKGAGTELLKQCSIDSFNCGKNGAFSLRSGDYSSDAFYRHIGLYGHQGFFELPECAVSDFLLK